MKEKYAKMSDVQKAQEEWLKIFLESGGEGIVLYAMLKMVIDESMGKIPTVELDLEAKEETPTREAEQGEDQTGRRGMDFGQALGGEARFSFGDAIKYLKRGMKLSRRGWNGKNQHIELAKAISYVSCPNGELVAPFEDNDSDEAGVDYYYNMSLMDKQAAAGLIESDVIYQIARDAAMDAAEERSEEQ